MFPDLPARPTTGLAMAERFGLPGGLMGGGHTVPGQDSPRPPAGFTFLGQLIDHNITFDQTTMLGQDTDPLRVTDFRPPRLDLANLYGTGPVSQPYLYDPGSHQTRLTASADGTDAARTPSGTALIADPQRAKKVNATLNTQLLDLPISAVPGSQQGALARPVASLAVRNLLRRESLELPSVQDAARNVGEVPSPTSSSARPGPSTCGTACSRRPRHTEGRRLPDRSARGSSPGRSSG